MRFILFIITFVIALLWPVTVSADPQPLIVSYNFGIFKEEDTVVFYGEISNSSAFALIEVLGIENPETLVIMSPGGAMSGALAIGEFLKNSDISVLIREETSCMSACAFAVMAANDLEIRGNLMFHTPYFPLVSTQETLDSLFLTSSVSHLILIEWFVYNGYTLEFYRKILENTSITTYINFTSTADFARYRSADPLQKLAENEHPYTLVTLE